MAHNSRFRQLGEEQHPRLSTLNPGERTPRVEAFPTLFFCRTTLPKAVDWLPVPSLRKIADTLVNTVVFLRLVLHEPTRTLFSFQGTGSSIT